MLKCTLSHDSERITHKFVDDKGRVHVAVLEGWPAAIFCSIDKEYMEEFATRVFTVTPNTDRNKIVVANEAEPSTKTDPLAHTTPLESNNGISPNPKHQTRPTNARPQEARNHRPLHSTDKLRKRRVERCPRQKSRRGK